MYYWSVHIFYFFLIHFWQVVGFQEFIISPDYPVCQHIICSYQFLMILCISVVSLVMSSLPLLILFIQVLLLSFQSSYRFASLIFLKNQLLLSLIFFFCYFSYLHFTYFYFNLCYLFPFAHLGLSFSFSRKRKYKVRLFEILLF